MFSLRNISVRNLIKNKSICGSRINLKRNFSLAESPIRAENMDKLISSHYPNFVEEMKNLVENFDQFGAGKHIEKVLNYNASGGKKNRARMVVAAFEEIAPDHRLTEDNLLLSIHLGWCLEVYHATVLMLDDIMDGSKTRRGQACWYMHPDVRFRAINDAVILDATIYNFLHKHFNSLQCYGRIIETFHKNAFLLNMGQFMDLSAEQQDVITFTMDQFRKTVIHKTAHHSFYVPIELAYNLAGQTDIQTLHAAREILYEMGIFFQIQDDFLDCYGDPKVTGKFGTDIEDGKCTWLIVTFLNRADRAQKNILKESYGKEDAESVARVKQLYNEVGLPEAYKNYEEETYKMLKKDIQEAEGIPKKICHRLMDKLYGRKV